MIQALLPFPRLLAALLIAGLAIAIVWPTHAAPAGEAKPHLAATDPDLLSILPPPPANGSAEDRAQQEEVLKAEHAASATRVAQARYLKIKTNHVSRSTNINSFVFDGTAQDEKVSQ